MSSLGAGLSLRVRRAVVALRSAFVDRPFRRLAAASAVVTLVLWLIAAGAAPKGQGMALLAIIALSGTTVVVLAWLGGSLSVRLQTLAGLGLMVLGAAAGGLLPDGLDAVAVLPLAGVLLALPAHRGRRRVAIFGVAYGASMLGEAAAYSFGGMSHLGFLVEAPIGVLEAAVMLALTYGLVWWVGQRWLSASEEARRAIASQRRLLEINERLLSTLDPASVLDHIADSLRSVVAYDNLTIYRVDRAAGLLRPVLARDRFASLIMDATFPFDRGITGWVVEHGQAECVNAAQHDSRMTVIPGTPEEAESLIVVPLFIDGKVAGTLNVGRMGEAASGFRPDEFEVAKLFASQASIALENADAHGAIKARAETDALTGLRNRGEFDLRLAALTTDPEARPLCVVMIDLDEFKAYNDGRGHPAGDALLRAAGRAISAAVREGDLCFRYGGDEFAVLLPRADEERAARVAERMHRAISATPEAAGASVTASIGVACAPGDSITGDELVARADAALYRAKQSGGNRVETADWRDVKAG